MIMRSLFKPLIGLLLVMLAISMEAADAASQTAEQGRSYALTLDADDYGLERTGFELWVPASVGDEHPVRFAVMIPKYQADRTIFERSDWRDFARVHRGALLRHDMLGTDAGHPNRLPTDERAIAALTEAMQRFAELAELDSLRHAPLVITGLSQGGWQSTSLAALVPDRTAAVIAYHGGGFPEAGKREAVHDVPMLFPLGQRDAVTTYVYPGLVNEMRHRPVWAGLFQPAVPHHTLGDQGFILRWLATVLDARLPTRWSVDDRPELRTLDFDSGAVGNMRLNERFQASEIAITPVQSLAPEERRGHWVPAPLAEAWRVATLTESLDGHLEREELAGFARPVVSPIRIDGQLEDWGTLSLGTTPPAQILPHGLDWHGPEDLSARFGAVYDAEWLYFAVRVVDDDLSFAGQAPWARGQDGIELRLDARSVVDRMSNVGHGEGRVFALLAVGPDAEGRPARVIKNGLPEDTEVATTTSPAGYAVEIRIPRRYFDERQSGDSRRFRLNLAVNDADHGGAKSQVWWRPDWRSAMNWHGSGTIERRP